MEDRFVERQRIKQPWIDRRPRSFIKNVGRGTTFGTSDIHPSGRSEALLARLSDLSRQDPIDLNAIRSNRHAHEVLADNEVPPFRFPCGVRSPLRLPEVGASWISVMWLNTASFGFVRAKTSLPVRAWCDAPEPP